MGSTELRLCKSSFFYSSCRVGCFRPTHLSFWVSAEMQEGEDIEARQEGCGEGICLKDEDGPESVRVSIFFSFPLRYLHVK